MQNVLIELTLSRNLVGLFIDEKPTRLRARGSSFNSYTLKEETFVDRNFRVRAKLRNFYNPRVKAYLDVHFSGWLVLKDFTSINFCG